MTDFRVAVVCSSNQNRSMEAHSCLSKKGFNVRSFGTGNQVKLPGPSPNMPNIYDFSTTYEEMYKDLLRKDSELYPFLNFPGVFFERDKGFSRKKSHGAIAMTTTDPCRTRLMVYYSTIADAGCSIFQGQGYWRMDKGFVQYKLYEPR